MSVSFRKSEAHAKTFTAKQTIFSGLIFAKYMDLTKNVLKTNTLGEQ